MIPCGNTLNQLLLYVLCQVAWDYEGWIQKVLICRERSTSVESLMDCLFSRGRYGHGQSPQAGSRAKYWMLYYVFNLLSLIRYSLFIIRYSRFSLLTMNYVEFIVHFTQKLPWCNENPHFSPKNRHFWEICSWSLFSSLFTCIYDESEARFTSSTMIFMPDVTVFVSCE